MKRFILLLCLIGLPVVSARVLKQNSPEPSLSQEHEPSNFTEIKPCEIIEVTDIISYYFTTFYHIINL